MKRLVLAALLLVPSLASAQFVTLADLSWFAGRWVDDSGGNLSEETWTAPSGDSMQGMWRYVSGGTTVIYELLTITTEPGGIVMRLRHFDPKLAGREDKTGPIEMKLVSSKERQASFLGEEAGVKGSVRLTYSRPSDDRFVCVLEKEGNKEEFAFRRAPQ
jgi:Domain of unknown function (DUF6265)